VSAPSGLTGARLAQALFAPRAVALVGASGDPKKNTARPQRFLARHGFRGQVYPVNATRPEVLGLKAHARVTDLPGPVDQAFVMVPAEHVPQALEQCAAHGVPLVTVYSDGFGETGEAGLRVQQALAARARELGVRLLGPNCIGLIDLRSGCALTVNAALEMPTPAAGPLALVSQSGAMMGSILSRGVARGVGFSRLVSVGNEADVGVGELIDLLVDDDATGAILLFLETIRDRERFAAACARAAGAGKPVIAYKLGRSALGQALAQSHTGAIAGSDAAFGAFLRHCRVARVESLESLFESAPLFLRCAWQATALPERPAPVRVGVVTTTGGGAATVVDRLGLTGIEAVVPPPAFVQAMAARAVTIRPAPIIDLTLAATRDSYATVLRGMLAADWCDAVLAVVGTSAQFHPQLAVAPILEASGTAAKPLAAFLAPDAPAALGALQQGGVPAFRTPEGCADALTAYVDWLRTAREAAGRPAAIGTPPGVAWPDDVPRAGALTEYQAGRVAAALGVPMVASVELGAPGRAHGLAYPVVLKASSAELPHKTEAGAVVLGIADDAGLQAAAARIVESVARHAPGVRIARWLVQPMVRGLGEVMLGYRVDPSVGPTVVLAAGGVLAEVLGDAVVRVAPVDDAQALQMIGELRSARRWTGYRNLPRGDVAALARAIAAFSRLAVLEGVAVAEAEINPLIVRGEGEGVVGVDALLRLGSPDAAGAA
jgi:acyl-CoA synthetase (NDP forming)